MALEGGCYCGKVRYVSEGKPVIRVFQGRRVIIDDNCPVRNGTTDGLVYTTYLFGPGAF